MYRAAAAYPHVDRERATASLRRQLRIMALAGDAAPDWSTFVVDGPTEQPGPHGHVWFEWTATVNAHGGCDLTRVDEDLPAAAGIGGTPTLSMPAVSD